LLFLSCSTEQHFFESNTIYRAPLKRYSNLIDYFHKIKWDKLLLHVIFSNNWRQFDKYKKFETISASFNYILFTFSVLPSVGFSETYSFFSFSVRNFLTTNFKMSRRPLSHDWESSDDKSRSLYKFFTLDYHWIVLHRFCALPLNSFVFPMPKWNGFKPGNRF
jgi:hypothetical protein